MAQTKRLAGSVLGAILLCCACGSTAHARKVASAGAAYGRATEVLLQVTEETAADADSARLLSEAQGLARDERRALLEKHAPVSQTLADLERLRRHARLLVRYFEALGRLADNDSDTEAADATASAATALNRLGQELTGSTLLTAPERDLLSQTARLSVEVARRHAIGREISARADSIDREIRIQQSAPRRPAPQAARRPRDDGEPRARARRHAPLRRERRRGPPRAGWPCGAVTS